MLLFKLCNINETSYQQHFFFVLYLSHSLSHFSRSSLSLLLCPHAWLTPPSPLLSPTTYHHSLSFYSPAVLDSLPLISSCIPLFQPSLNLFHQLPPPPLSSPFLFLPVSLSFSVHLFLTLYGRPAGHFCPVHPLWENNSL